MLVVPARSSAVGSRLTLRPRGAHRPVVVVTWPAKRSIADALVWLSAELSTATDRPWSLTYDSPPAVDFPSGGQSLSLAQCRLRDPVIPELLACLALPPRSTTFQQAVATAFVESLRSAVAR